MRIVNTRQVRNVLAQYYWSVWPKLTPSVKPWFFLQKFCGKFCRSGLRLAKGLFLNFWSKIMIKLGSKYIINLNLKKFSLWEYFITSIAEYSWSYLLKPSKILIFQTIKNIHLNGSFVTFTSYVNKFEMEMNKSIFRRH